MCVEFFLLYSRPETGFERVGGRGRRNTPVEEGFGKPWVFEKVKFLSPAQVKKMPQEIGVFLCEVESSQTPKRGPNDMKEEHRIVTARLEDQNQEQEICQKF